jgi:hypothetical protein
MHSVLAVGLALSIAASEPAPPATESVDRNVEAAVVAERPAAPEVAPVLFQAEQPRHAERPAEAAATPPRGSFWWTVGAIVVAGLILMLIR